MLKFRNLTVLGTSHIARESIQEVERIITEKKPDIIAIELDLARYRAIVSQKKALSSFKKLDFKTFIINYIGACAEKSLGKQTGIKPGTEMKTAIKLAKINKIPLFLIDQPINITLRKLSQITRKEKITLIKDFFITIFKKGNISFDLNKVPSKKIINSLIKETRERYPTIYKVLVEERNVYMAKALYKIINKFPNKEILAIVGAGHESEIIGELKSIKN